MEKQNLTIEIGAAEEQFDWVPSLATELVRLGVDVIVASGTGVN